MLTDVPPLPAFFQSPWLGWLRPLGGRHTLGLPSHPVAVGFLYLGGATGVVVALLGILAAVNRISAKRRGDAEQAQLVARLREEIDLLKQENALLRSEQQRPRSLGQAAGAIRRLPAQANRLDDDGDEGDEAWATVTDATVLKATLASVCSDLQTAIHHVQRQLTTGIPAPELDRRVTGREPPPAANSAWLRREA